jgi:uncharacterized protein YjgD (DUF1641 family)
MKGKIFMFNMEGLRDNNNLVAERAYKKAAKCTVHKINKVLKMKDVNKAIKELEDYRKYLGGLYLEER